MTALGTWVSQVRGLGCMGVGYEAQQPWGQWRRQGSNHELYASTHIHTRGDQGEVIASHRTHECRQCWPCVDG